MVSLGEVGCPGVRPVVVGAEAVEEDLDAIPLGHLLFVFEGLELQMQLPAVALDAVLAGAVEHGAADAVPGEGAEVDAAVGVVTVGGLDQPLLGVRVNVVARKDLEQIRLRGEGHGAGRSHLHVVGDQAVASGVLHRKVTFLRVVVTQAERGHRNRGAADDGHRRARKNAELAPPATAIRRCVTLAATLCNDLGVASEPTTRSAMTVR